MVNVCGFQYTFPSYLDSNQIKRLVEGVDTGPFSLAKNSQLG